ncbi:MAG: T9SS type A sorting domain-containing protein [Bacteroidota bacterium]|nr:T9SS type A sorting domain-containing protein [Bacteroidota bacterium]
MNKRFIPIFSIAALIFSSQADAQKNTAFAVTAATKGNYNWNVIREIDLTTGEVLRTIYDPSVNKVVNYKSAIGTELKPNLTPLAATGSGVAAAAYDALHNRLYFTNMHGDALQYFDLNSKDLNVVVDNNPAFNTGVKNKEANVVTRMSFASDGFGYAISNDGNGFVRFSTDDQSKVTNLGALVDGSKNGKISIHDQATSWGGDVVGDAYGNLYLVTYRHHMFRINPKTRVADYLGQIKGVPEQFTSNGAVVSDDGHLIISSATVTDNYYQVNIATLEATPIQKTGTAVFNSSDLANSNLLYQKRGTPNLFFNDVKENTALSVFPNPATEKFFNLQFNHVPAGKYNMVLADASGRTVLSKSVIIALKGQVEHVVLPSTIGSGTYYVKLVGSLGAASFNQEVVVH